MIYFLSPQKSGAHQFLYSFMMIPSQDDTSSFLLVHICNRKLQEWVIYNGSYAHSEPEFLTITNPTLPLYSAGVHSKSCAYVREERPIDACVCILGGSF